jgi:peptidoglycan hydrolase-like protein with peptidoglycan-binding domain
MQDSVTCDSPVSDISTAASRDGCHTQGFTFSAERSRAMRLQGRNLRVGMSGEDVAQLHRELLTMGYHLPEQERVSRSYGAGTADAVVQFQRSRGLSPTTVVDAQTAGMLGRAVGEIPEETMMMPRGEPPKTPDVTVTPPEPTANLEPRTALEEPEAPEPPVTKGKAAVVHRALDAMGVEVDDAERQQNVLGTSTREALARIQALVGLEPSGELDESTMTLARAALQRFGGKEDAIVVEGMVTDANGLPMAGATVTVHKRGLRESEPLQQTTTDAAGNYRIVYPSPPASLDLQVEATDAAGKTLLRSPVLHKAGRLATVNLGEKADPAEFVAMGRAISRRLGKLKLEELTEDSRHKDITFLSGDTGRTPAEVALFAVSARLARRTQLPEEMFYALLREKVPADAEVTVLASTSEGVDLEKNSDRLLKAIFATTPQARAKAVQAAIGSGVIQADYAKRAEADLKKVTELAADAALGDSHGMGKTPMATVLAAAAISAEKQQRFIGLFTGQARPTKSFWRNLAKNPDFTKDEVATIKFATDVGRVARGHLPLVEALLEKRRGGSVKGTRDLARLSAKDWEAMVRGQRNGRPIGIPANLTAQDDEQAIKAYAYLLERRFERMHPTTAFAARLAEDTESPFAAKDSVATFLDANPGFSLRRSNVDGYLAAKQQSVAPELRDGLLLSQRMLKLTDRYVVAKPMLKDNLHSAQQIYALGRSQFVGAYRDNPDVGAAQAARTYALAEQTYALSLALLMNVNAPMVGVSPAAAGPAPAQPSADGLPNLQTLFGSLDMCECAHCRSVLSPAAYLVDMLQFLGKRITGGVSARQILLQRRPDLAQIELSCANTNTVMPYIDLVNEILEDAVAPPADPAATQRKRQTTLATDELNANPEHVNNAAYAKLATEVFPWKLPFDLPLNETRIYLRNLGADRVSLMRTFGAPANEMLAVEGLGLSAVEADILTNPGTTPWKYWGLAQAGNTVPDPVDHTVSYTGSWLEVLSRVRVLLDRAQLSYNDLTALLETGYVNPGQTVTIKCDPPDSCDLKDMTVQGLTAEVADRLHRFVRLQGKLNWEVNETDTAIAGNIDTLLLRKLFAVKAAAQRLSVPVTDALVLQGRLETGLYRQLFQNKAVLNPVDPAFALNPAGTEVAITGATLTDHRQAMVAAFELSDADLALAIAGLTDSALTLANLTRLYGAVVLARGLGLSMADLLSMLKLVEIDPFDAAAPESLHAFCEEVERVRQTRFSIGQLDYLLRHKGDDPDSIAVGTLLKSVRDKGAAKGVVVQELSDALGLPTATVAAVDTVVTQWLTLPGVARHPSKKDSPIAPDEPGFAVFFDGYETLAKFAAIVTGFGLTADDTAWLRAHGIAAGWLDPLALPLTESDTAQGRYARWRRAADAAAVKSALPAGSTALMDLALGTADKATYFDALHDLTGWSRETLGKLAGDPANAADKGPLQLAYPDDYRSELALAKLVPAVKMLRRLGISADVSGWLGAIVTPQQADAIKQSVKGKYSAQRWAAVAKALRDPLREQQRDALVGYLLSHPPSGVKRWHDTNDVYAKYLIDVDMSSCQGTSRIVQANASIQLFVQRCILNLEPGVTVDAEADEDWLQWKWMSRYRVWEANRKVFCYPENWIEPSLRPDKSPFYREMENDLLQGEVTKEAAEDALRSYLEKLAAVARLDIAGVYHEVRSEKSENATTLHVFGRKQGNPPQYYYRQWIDSSRWTSWTKVELDIHSDHVLPIVWNRRLYLFWAVANRKPDRTQKNPKMEISSSSPQEAKTHLEVQLAWSEFKGSKWQPTQTSPQALVFPEDIDPHEITLKSQLVDPLLRIDIFSAYGHTRVHAGQFVLGGTGNSVDAYVTSGNGLSEIGKQTRGIGMLPSSLYMGTLYAPPNSNFDSMSIVPVTTTYHSGVRPRTTVASTTYELYGALSNEPVLNLADRYRILVPHQHLWFDSVLPFFYSDSRRSYFVVPTRYYKSGNYFVTTAPASVYQPVYKPRYSFFPNYHAFVGTFLRELNRGGVDALYERSLQLNPGASFDFKSYYQPTDNVIGPYPTEGVDFERHAGYSGYNWELFFHTPFAIADALSRNQRFEEAKHWYEYIFNPTSASKDAVPRKFWITKPFYQMTDADYWKQQIESLMKLINTGDKAAEEQVLEWRRNPFEPHLIAGLRPVAYQRAVVMRYIDNLIAWGDQLFRQDTLESVNEATQLYVLAAELLGPRPEIVPRQDDSKPMTFADMAGKLDEFSNVVAAAENAIPPAQVNAPIDPNIPKLPVLPPLYFGIQPNAQLLGYWDKVADRLYKVRHCMNIEGVVRQLALFAPPIDPALLVKAAAAGLDLGSVLSDMSAPLPPYRFRILLRQAIELARNVQGLGNELMAALQVRDAGKLDLLRAGAERKLQGDITQVQTKAIDEAAQRIEVLKLNQAVLKQRQDYFSGITEDLMNGWEVAAMAMTGGSIVAQGIAMAMEATSGAAHAVVDLQFGGSGAGGSPHATVKFGGENVGSAAAAVARISKIAAAALQTGAQMASITAQYQRRQQEWKFQAEQAASELKVIEGELVSADIRKELAEKTAANHETVVETAEAVDEFLRDKFTNVELYEWMIAQTSATYFQAYQLAYTVAKRAERCFRRELGLKDSSYIQFGYWDSLKKGLGTADRLLHDLHRMAAAFLAEHERELEMTKHVSLLQLDPYALMQLRTHGECVMHLPELLFDLDNPGHYKRTIMSVGVTVPCVAGPYTGVPLTLTLLDNHIRDSVEITPQYERLSAEDGRFNDDMGGTQAIVTSGGQADTGMFERRFDDDRYLPFEGAGAISTWKLRLNPVYPQFDYRSISDVVLHMAFTALDGGAPLATEATKAVKATLNKVALAESRSGLYWMVSAKQEFGAAWHKFLHPAGEQDQVLVLDTEADRFAFFTRGMDIKVTGVDVVAKLVGGNYTLELTRPGVSTPATATMEPDAALGGLHHWADEALAPKSSIGRAPASPPHPQWTVKLRQEGAADFRSLREGDVEDIVLILRYEVTP